MSKEKIMQRFDCEAGHPLLESRADVARRPHQRGHRQQISQRKTPSLALTKL
jgi:hypothetical protein